MCPQGQAGIQGGAEALEGEGCAHHVGEQPGESIRWRGIGGEGLWSTEDFRTFLKKPSQHILTWEISMLWPKPWVSLEISKI